MKWHKFPDVKPTKHVLLVIGFCAATAPGKKFYRYEIGYFTGEDFVVLEQTHKRELIKPVDGRMVYWFEFDLIDEE